MTIVLCVFSTLSFLMSIGAPKPADAIYWATGCGILTAVAFR